MAEEVTPTNPSQQQAPPAGDAGGGDGGGGKETPTPPTAEGNGGESGEGGGDDDPPAKPSTPEKYELKLPDDSKLESAHLEGVSTFAKELGLSQEQAQKLLDRDNQILSQHTAAQQKQWQDEVDSWADQVKNDKEIGGDHFEVAVSDARKAIEAFATPEFKTKLDESGFGNHPELVRVFARIGKAMGEDKFHGGSDPASPAALSTAEILYPNSK